MTAADLKEARRKAKNRIRQRRFYARHRPEILEKKSLHYFRDHYASVTQSFPNSRVCESESE